MKKPEKKEQYPSAYDDFQNGKVTGHNKAIEEYDKYHKQEIKSQKAIAFREGWEMLEQKLSVENIESAIEDAFWEAEENGKSLDYRGTAEAIHKLTKE